jgi:hypothetical protein
MRRPARILLAAALRGLASAFLLIVAAFVISMKSREAAHLLLAPGGFLVQVSNWICPPLGVECVLGSRRPGAHQLWLLACAFAAWAALFSAAWWWGLRRAQPPDPDGEYIFLNKGKELS